MKRIIYLLLMLLPVSALAGNQVVFIKLEKPRSALYKSNPQRTGLNKVDATLSAFNINYIQSVTAGMTIDDRESLLSQWLRCEFPAATDTAQLIKQLQTLPGIAAAQPNHVYHLHYIPNDPDIDEQYALPRIKAYEAWEVERGSPNVPVAVIDTGIDYYHPDLAAGMWMNSGEDVNNNGLVDADDFNGIDDDNNGFIDDLRGWDFTDAPNYPDGGDYLERDNDPMDKMGHGTGVAGIIAAQADNNIGIAGLAHHCRIMNLRAFTDGGNGEEDDVASAILYAINNGARIINMSWGDVFVSRLMDDIIRYGESRNIIMVASAGNSSTTDIHYPSAFAGTISVGATDSQDRLAGFSNYGPSVDLVAPGENIYTTTLNENYTTMNGTSFSAPFVSAAAALLLSQNPQLSAEAVSSLLTSSADDLGEAGVDKYYGAGRLNGYSLLNTSYHARVKISSPVLDEGISSGPLAIWGSAWSPAFDSFSLYYGEGDAPDEWIAIEGIQTKRVLDGILASWNNLPDVEGSYTLRLRVDNRDGTSIMDHVRIFIDKTPPVITNVELLPMLDGDRYVVMVQFATDDLCEGSLFYRRAGSNDEFQEAVMAYRTTQLRYVLTPEEMTGRLEIRVQARNRAGLVSEDDFNGNYYFADLSMPPVNITGFTPLALTIPAGHLMNATFDFNNNGLPELVLSQYREGNIGNIGFYEYNNSEMRQVFSLDEALIPRDLADIDGDGIPELLCGFGYSGYIYKSPGVGQFPSQLHASWEGNNSVQYWVSRLVDVNRDGKADLIMRVVKSGSEAESDQFEVWQQNAAGQFQLSAALPNPTAGENFNGVPHCEVMDFNGNGRMEILIGDSDGDLYIYEYTAPDTWTNIWQDSLPLLDSIDFITAGDFDGDSQAEFIAGCHSDPNLNTEHYYDARHWLFRMYDCGSAATPQPGHEWRFFGFESTRDFPSGVSCGDLDNDGRDEIVLTLFPDLYILEENASDAMEIIHHYYPVQSNNAIITDADVSGNNECWVSTGNVTMALTPVGYGSGPAVPVGLQAIPLDENRVVLQWRQVSGAGQYLILRSMDGVHFIHYDSAFTTTFTDTMVTSGTMYYYAVVTIDSAKSPAASLPSFPVSARPGVRPYVVSATAESVSSIRLIFSEPMNESIKNAAHYMISGNIGRPTSAALDASGRQALLTFAKVLADGSVYRVTCHSLADLDNTPLDSTRNFADFSVTLPPPAPWLVDGRLLGSSTLELEFNQDMQETSVTDVANYDMGNEITITAAEFTGDSKNLVRLTMQTEKNIGALGSSYSIKVKNVKNMQGVAIQPGRGDCLLLIYAKNNLSQVFTFPNPWKPGISSAGITFANLTRTAEITIFTSEGLPIRTIAETNGDGGVEWDLCDDQGNLVSAGIYIYRIVNKDEHVLGKLAIIR